MAPLSDSKFDWLPKVLPSEEYMVLYLLLDQL